MMCRSDVNRRVGSMSHCPCRRLSSKLTRLHKNVHTQTHTGRNSNCVDAVNTQIGGKETQLKSLVFKSQWYTQRLKTTGRKLRYSSQLWPPDNSFSSVVLCVCVCTYVWALASGLCSLVNRWIEVVQPRLRWAESHTLRSRSLFPHLSQYPLAGF